MNGLSYKNRLYSAKDRQYRIQHRAMLRLAPTQWKRHGILSEAAKKI